MNRAERQQHIANLQKISDSLYKQYDRAFRNISANEAECQEKHHAWMNAQDAVNEAKYEDAMANYEFAEMLGTSGFTKKPERKHFNLTEKQEKVDEENKMKKSEIVRCAAVIIKDGINIFSCNAINLVSPADYPVYVAGEYYAYVRKNFGIPAWWGEFHKEKHEEHKALRVTFLESFASYLENIGE